MAYVMSEETATKAPRQYCGEIADFLEAHPTAWVRHTFATRADGVMCDPRSPMAVAWCALGLLQRFVHDRDVQGRCERLLARAITPYGALLMCSPARFNDTEAHDVRDVIRMYRAASYLPDVRDVMPAKQVKSEQWATESGELSEATLNLAMMDALKMQSAVQPPTWFKVMIGSNVTAANEDPAKSCEPFVCSKFLKFFDKAAA